MSSSSSPTTNSKAAAMGARLQMATMHARLTPAALYRRLNQDYQLGVSRTSVYDAINGRVEQPKFILEVAEITGVNVTWLKTGKGFVTDMSGRLGKKETAVRDVKRLLRQHIVPNGRNDLLRLADRFIDTVHQNRIGEDDVKMLAILLEKLRDQ